MSGPARPSELRPALVLLIAITAIGPFAMNVSVPLMPGLAKDFGTSYAVIQLTLTAYLVATAVSTPILGPLSDQHGRRPVLLAGIFIFMVGSLVCASAPTAEVLIAGRALQAVGGASGWVLARTVIYDVYGPRRAASLIGYVTMAMVLAPMVAPAIGGYVEPWAGWRAIFWALFAAGGALGAWCVVSLRETRHLSGGVVETVNLTTLQALFRLPAFWGYSINLGFASGMFFSFIAGAPFVVVEVMGLPAASYGHYFILISCGYMFGNFLSGRFSERVGSDRMIVAGCMVAFVGLAMLWLFRDFERPVGIFLPMAMIAISNGMTLPNGTASAMSLRPEFAGSASGIAGSIQLTIGAFMSVIVGALMVNSADPMILAMTASGLLSALGIMIALHPRKSGGAPRKRRAT